MTMLETMYLDGERKLRRNSPRRTTSPTTIRRCERHGRTTGECRKDSFRKESLKSGEYNKRERAKRGRIEPYIIARSGKNGETISSPLPRPFSISLLRYSSVAAFNDRAPTLSTLSHSSSTSSSRLTKSHQWRGLGTQRVLATSQLTR